MRRNAWYAIAAAIGAMSQAAIAQTTTGPAGPASGPVLVFADDFAKEPSACWSVRNTETSPSGRRFLGQLHNDAISLSLKELAAHEMVTVEFDLLLIRTWDGNNTEHGPDIWELAAAGGPTLLRTTFSNLDFYSGFQQAFPEWVGRGSYPPRTGSAERDVLGYTYEGPPEIGTRVVDSVYRFRFSFPHDEGDLVLQFSAAGLDGERSETWGLGNVSVSILSAPVPVADAVAENCWQDLGGESGERAFDATWTLIAAGDQAVGFLKGKLGDLIVDDKQVAKLIASLDDEDWRARERASLELAKLGRGTEPFLRKAVEGKPSLEAAARLEELIAKLQANPYSDEDLRRFERLAHVLRVIRSEQALRTLKALPPPPKPARKPAEPGAVRKPLPVVVPILPVP